MGEQFSFDGVRSFPHGIEGEVEVGEARRKIILGWVPTRESSKNRKSKRNTEDKELKSECWVNRYKSSYFVSMKGEVKSELMPKIPSISLLRP